MDQQHGTECLTVLSASAARQVDWDAVDNAMPAVALSAARDGGPAGPAEDEARRAINAVAREFGRVLDRTHKTTLWFVALAICALLVALVGVVLLAFARANWVGGTFNVAGLGVVTTLIFKFWQLANDQALLRLTPERYRLALNFCRTDEDRRLLINRFLDDDAPVAARPVRYAASDRPGGCRWRPVHPRRYR